MTRWEEEAIPSGMSPTSPEVNETNNDSGDDNIVAGVDNHAAADTAASEDNTDTWAEIRDGVAIAAPIALTLIVQFLSGPLNIIVVGRSFDEHAFTGVNLGMVSGNLVGLSFIAGIHSALDTLQPIAFGAKDYAEVGGLAIRGLVAAVSFVLICAPVWLFGESILLALGQPTETAAYAGRYLLLSYPAIVCNAIFETMRRFYASQNIFWPLFAIATAALVAQAAFLYVSLTLTDYAFTCIPIASVVFYGSCFLIAAVWSKYRAPYHPGTWTGFDREALAWPKMKAYLALAIPGLGGYSDWWFWEIVCLLVGTLGEHEQAAHAAAYMVIPIYYISNLGLGVGANVKIGHQLGLGNVDRAKALARRYQGMGMVGSVTYASLQYFLRPVIISVTVSSVPPAVERAERIWLWTCAMVLLDSFTAVDLCITRAIGQQKRLSYGVTFTYWAVGLPATYLVAFHFGLGLLGIWIVYPCIYVLIICVTQYVQRTADWNQCAEGEKTEPAGGADANDADVEMLIANNDPADACDVESDEFVI